MRREQMEALGLGVLLAVLAAVVFVACVFVGVLAFSWLL